MCLRYRESLRAVSSAPPCLCDLCTGITEADAPPHLAVAKAQARARSLADGAAAGDASGNNNNDDDSSGGGGGGGGHNDSAEVQEERRVAHKGCIFHNPPLAKELTSRTVFSVGTVQQQVRARASASRFKSRSKAVSKAATPLFSHRTLPGATL